MRTAFILFCTFLLTVSVHAQGSGLEKTFKAGILPLLENYCTGCHSEPDLEGGLDLELFSESPLNAAQRKTVRAIRRQIRDGTMPPAAAQNRPDKREKLAIIAWTSAALDHRPAIPDDPGRVVVRRLSRYEYDRTIKHVFGVQTPLSAKFPADDLAHGFDNLGGTATMSVLHLEKYADAAEDIARRMIDLEDPDNPTVRRFEAEDMDCDLDRATGGSVANLFSNATVSTKIKLPRSGTYKLRIRTWGDQAGPDPARMRVSWDHEALETLDVPEESKAPAIKELTIETSGGDHTVAVSFINDYYKPKAENPGDRDRNLKIDYVECVGPIDRREPSIGQEWLFALDKKKGKPAVRAKAMLKELCRRAWRRPPSTKELRRLTQLLESAMENGAGFAEGIQFTVQAVLVSPHFLYRIEPGDHRGKQDRIKDLKDYALATRLSYFLWSSAPDEELLDLARKRKLREPGVYEQQIERMLADSRAASLAESFAAQWLELRNLADTTPDAVQFPSFTDSLRAALIEESERFFLDVLITNSPATRLIDAEYTFVNDELAEYYGFEEAEGEGFRKVTLKDRRRGGLLGQGAVLAVTSNPTRTSPVKRGKWLLENIFGTPPPPPPPGVDSFKEGSVATAKDLREQMELHRRDPVCASCHIRMDALGLALEHYDAIGRWRDEDSGTAINARSTLPDGSEVSGIEDLRKLILNDEAFIRSLARRLFIYGVGRELDPADELAVDDMLKDCGGPQATLRDLIRGVALLDAFKKRRVVR